MPKYGIIRENKIVTIIVAPSQQSVEKMTQTSCIEINNSDDIGVGYTFDGTNWNKPVINDPSAEEN